MGKVPVVRWCRFHGTSVDRPTVRTLWVGCARPPSVAQVSVLRRGWAGDGAARPHERRDAEASEKGGHDTGGEGEVAIDLLYEL